MTELKLPLCTKSSRTHRSSTHKAVIRRVRYLKEYYRRQGYDFSTASEEEEQ